MICHYKMRQAQLVALMMLLALLGVVAMPPIADARNVTPFVVAVPEVSGPIASDSSSFPFIADGFDVEPPVPFGYIEEEFFVSGTGNIYEYTPTGIRVVDPCPEIAERGCTLLSYTTRMLVKRPRDLRDFSGTVIIEPLNSLVNHPGYFLTSGVEGLKAVKEADHPHVKLLFDIYHQQVQEGNIVDTLAKNVQHIAVFHVADCPGRHDPGTGELHYSNIYKAIAKTAFRGQIAMEYLPLAEQVASLTQAVGELRRAIS